MNNQKNNLVVQLLKLMGGICDFLVFGVARIYCGITE